MRAHLGHPTRVADGLATKKMSVSTAPLWHLFVLTVSYGKPFVSWSFLNPRFDTLFLLILSVVALFNNERHS